MDLGRKIAFVGLLAIVAGCTPPDDDTLVGQTPDFQVTAANDAKNVTLKDMKGKVVILDYWETTCGPCKALSPYIEKVYEKYHDQGVEGMAISNESKDAVLKFEKASPHEMPVYLDPNGIAGDALKVEAWPTLAVIGKDGRITYLTVGFPENAGPGLVGDQLDKAVSDALKA